MQPSPHWKVWEKIEKDPSPSGAAQLFLLRDAYQDAFDHWSERVFNAENS
jgi:hypothetical protein